MNYSLEDLIDIPLLQELQDKLNKIYSFPSAIIDNNGKVLTAVAWQDVCTKFHRTNLQCEKECIKSDQYIIEHIKEANPAVSYNCPHGLIDNATPIIIDGMHLGNFFTGQFFLEKPDIEFFKQQAKKYGFNEKEYIEAVNKVPIWTKEKLTLYLDFIKGFIEVIAGIGLKNLKEIETSKILKESEARNNSIIQSTSDWIWEIDKNGKYCYCSERVEKILGYTSAEMIGKSPFDFMSNEESEKVSIIFKKIIEAKSNIVDLENWNLHKDGHRVCLLTNGFPIFDTEQNLIGYRGADKDITYRKHIEYELQESNAKYQFIVENTNDILWTMTPDFNLDYVSTSVFKFLGYTQEEHLKQTLDDFVTPESAKLIRDEFSIGMMHFHKKEYDKLRNFAELEIEYIKKDKTHGFAIISMVFLRDKNYNLLKINGKTTDITERIIIEKKLKESEEKYRILINNSGIGVGVYALDGKILFFNQKAIQNLGGKEEDYIGKSLIEVFGNEAGLIYLQRIKAASESKSSLEYEDYVETDTGNFWFLSNHTKIKDGDGKIIGIQVLATDITERKLAERKLLESEEKFRAVSEYSFNSICIINEVGKIVWANQAMAKMGMFTIEMIYAADSFTAFIAPESLEFVVSNFMKFVKGEEYEHHYEFYFIRADGEKRLCEKHMSHFKDSNGKLNLVISMLDVTEKQQSLVLLKHSEENFRAIFESSSSAIAIIETDTTISMVNDEYLKISGYTRDEVIGLSWTKQIPPEDLERLKEYNRIRLINPKAAPDKYEFTFYRKDGEIRHSLMSVSMIENKNKIVASFVDITERKLSEKKLIQSEEKFRLFFEKSSDPITISNKNGDFVDCNTATLEFHGIKSKEELFKYKTTDTYEDPNERDLLITDLLNNGYINNREINFKTISGNIKTVLVSIEIININNVQLFVSWYRDITDRKQNEKLLEIRYKFEKLISEIQNDFLKISVDNLDSFIISAQRKFCQLLGMERSALWQGTITEPEVMYMTHLCTLDEIPPVPENVTTNSLFPWFTKQLLDGKIVAVNDVNSMAIESKVDKDNLLYYNDKATLAIPFSYGNPIVYGTISFASTKNVRAWSDEEFMYCQIFAQIISNIIARSNAEKLVRKSEETYKALFEGINDAIFISEFTNETKTNRFIEVNDIACKRYGYSREEFLNLTPFDINSEKTKFLLPTLLKGIKEKKHALIEVEHVKKDGSIIPVEISTHIIQYKNKTVYQSIARDITERKESEKKLKEIEKLFSLFMHYSPVYTFIKEVTQTESRVIQASENYKNMIGIPGSEMIGKTMEELFPPEFASKITADDWSVVKKREIFQEDEFLNGFYYTTIKFPIEFDGKNLLAGFTIDITDRKNTEEKIKESEEKFRYIAENTFDGILGFGPDQKINYVSPSYIKQLGYTIEESLGKDAEEIALNIHPDDKDELFAKIYNAIKLKLPDLIYTYRVKNKKGEYLWREDHAKFSYDIYDNYSGSVVICRDITERRQIEAKLREKDIEFRKLSANVPDLIFQFTRKPDGSYCVPVASEGIVNIFGCSPEDVLNDFTPIAKVIYPEDAERVIADIEFSAKNLTYFTCEFRVQIPGKEIQWIYSRSNPEKLPDGSIAWYGFNVDITRLKQIEIELIKAKEKAEKNERKLIEAQAVAKVGSWETNLITMDVIWSDETYKIFGLNKEQFKNTHISFLDYVHPDDIDRIEDVFTKSFSSKDYNSVQHRIITPLGEIKHVEERWITFQDSNNKPIMSFGTCQDITENKIIQTQLKKAKEKAEESESVLQLIIDNFPNANATLLDNNLNIVLTGGSEYIKYGFNPKNLRNKHVSEILSKDNYDKLKFNIDKAIKGETSNYEVEYKDGVFYMNYVTPIKFSEDIISNFLIANINITDLKQTQLDLIKAKEKAEESDRLKSAFLANMSHEIRTPMNGILGFAELLKLPDLKTEKQKDYIKIIEESGNRMLNIINDIINISKVEAGLMDLNISETNINKQIDYIYSFFKPEAESKGLKLIHKKSLQNNESIIKTDSQKLNSILTNLLKNSLKFTPDGVIEIGYVKKENILEFYVKDTGIGIPLHQKELIFERFRQGSEQLNRKYEGSGLGLSISKAYVEMMGGKIWVKKDSEGNSNEKGSEFYFTLPYNPVSEEEIEIIHEPVSSINNKINSKKLKALIVEDDEASMIFNKISVEDFCHEILFAVNGNEAVTYCKQNPDIDLILMDIKLPDLDGYEATQQIRHFNKKVIIIAQTAFALAGDREKAIEAGCNDYLTKPYNKSMLGEKIMKYFLK
ncbi:MAG: PAS domain S-box protein [Bacteroidia bacterium]|nr:PAS domain S-box protein [Bacteroidia bacterium]